MKSIMIQFHSQPNETLDFIKKVSAEFGLSVVMMKLSPYRVERVESAAALQLKEVTKFREQGRLRIHLLIGDGNLAARTPNEFLDLNPGCLVINVGGAKGRELEESAFMLRSDDELAIRAANKVASQLRKMTKAGVVAVNPDSGAESAMRSHRYTEGAKRFFEQGNTLLPAAGKSVLKIPD